MKSIKYIYIYKKDGKTSEGAGKTELAAVE